MGNQQGQHPSKSSSDTHASSDPLEAQRKRLRSAFQVWIERTKASEVLDEDRFKNGLFPLHAEYGGLLYRFMLGDAEVSSRGLTADRYIESATTILQPPNASPLELFFNIFSGSQKCITKKEVAVMLDLCYQITWYCSHVAMSDTRLDEQTTNSVINNMFAQSAEISQSDFSSWCGRHCRQLFDGIHQITCAVLLGDDSLVSSQDAASGDAKSEFIHQVAAGSGPLSSGILWLLTTSLPASFFPATDAGGSSATSVSLPLVQVCSPEGWHLLYDSNEQGLSVNRYQHHVFEYKGATLTFLTFAGHVYCIAADSEWREGRQRFGGFDSCLIQMHPKYAVMQSGPDMLYVNFSDRTVPRGMQIGKDVRTLILSLDDGLSKVTHYGTPTELHRLQVWGCAGLLTKEAQLKQQKWEKQEAQKSKDRKIKLDDWENNPDRQILEMGGVTTEHAQR